MASIQLLALFGFIITLQLVVSYGISLRRKAKSESDKKFITGYFIVLAVTFTAGAITYTLQQIQASENLAGIVIIFGGLFILLWGVPFFWTINQNKLNGFKRTLSLLLGLFFALLGLGIIAFGITQIWAAFR